MTAHTGEVKAILKALGKKMDKEASDYTGQHIAMSLYGLQWMSGHRYSMQSTVLYPSCLLSTVLWWWST